MSGTVGNAPAAPVSAARAALNVAIFLAALSIVCASISSRVPFPEVAGVYQKWLYFKKYKDRYDVLFVGSSRFYHQIIPQQFDEEVKTGSGGDVRSFNFGYDAMWPPESFYMLRKVLATRPKRLRWVFIDGIDIITGVNKEEMSTRRIAYWHDVPHTWMAWQKVAESRMAFQMKWSLWAEHGGILFRQLTNQGLGAEWLGYEFGVVRRKKAERWDPPKAWKDTEGYEAENEQRFAGDDRVKFERDVKSAAASFPSKPVSPSYRRALEDISREVRAAGAEPILVLTPTIDLRESFSDFPPELPVWSYQGPNEFPALYDANNHYDAAHLNDSGARIFTQLLASRFAELLKQKK